MHCSISKNYGRRISEPEIPTLKFTNDGWLLRGAPFGDTKMIADMPSLRRGWVRHDSGFAVKELMVDISKGFEPPPREDLGELDEARWEKDERGWVLDPWHATIELRLWTIDELNTHRLIIDLADFWRYECEGFALVSLGTLCRIYAAHAAPDDLPIIQLTKRVLFTHPIYGAAAIPQIDVVGWRRSPRAAPLEKKDPDPIKLPKRRRS